MITCLSSLNWLRLSSARQSKEKKSFRFNACVLLDEEKIVIQRKKRSSGKRESMMARSFQWPVVPFLSL